MRGRVAGKVALITGAAQGMGAAHARALAREGANGGDRGHRRRRGRALAAELRRPAARPHITTTT